MSSHYDPPARELSPDKAARYAYRLLAARPVSEQEFREKLKGKGHGTAVVEEVARRFKELGYLNDASFSRQQARTWAVNRLWGNYRIARTLKEKGIAGDLIDDAVARAREEITEEAAVLKILRNKCKGSAVVPEDRKAQRRLLQSLMGKGFPPGLIFEMLAIRGEETVYDGE